MNEPLAIVGMACRLPGADGLEAFWRLVRDGGTAWGALPESRLSRALYFEAEKGRIGKSYSELGAIVSDRPVDPAVCPLTGDMTERYDIAHHIFLEVASLACRDAGMDPFAMPTDRRTGVYVGHTGGSPRISDIGYATGIDETASLLGAVDAAREVLGDAVGEVADEVVSAVRRRYHGRHPGQETHLGAIGAAQIVREALRLDGPSLVVDAACASALQALAIAARALAQGGVDQAIVGGASYCKSDSLVLFSAAQSVSNTGSCPFGEAADGLVAAEGYVALVIKTLSRAVADGDRIRAVIRGLGVSSDGKGKSLWAPRQEGQVLAVERAYADPADLGRIEYIEAHATSTQVGDATELAALSRLVRPHVPSGRTIPLGSVKANIGHTLETAGIASLVKVVLALEHGSIPPGSTCTELNTTFDWASGPFHVPREPVAWPPHADGSPRMAAINAFGIGGLNVHVVLSEHVPGAPAARLQRPARHDDAIAVVGAGCVLPGSPSLEAFLARVKRGESAIGPVPADRWLAGRALDRTRPRTWHTLSDRGGFVRDFAYDWRRHKVPPKQIAAANPLQFMLLEAADAAIGDAGGPSAGLDRVRTGVVVGTLFGGDFANELQMGLRLPETGRDLRASLARRGVAAADVDRIVEAYEKKVLDVMPALVDETGSFTSSTLASRLTKTFDFMGGALAIDAGDCSSVAALSAAADMLREGTCDAVLCAAGQRSLDLMAYEGHSLAGRLTATGEQGAFVPGEGAVVLVLKRLEDAEAAGNRIRGVIRAATVRPATPADDRRVPPLTSLIGHTGAAAAAAELLAALDGSPRGTIDVCDGTLAATITMADATVPASEPAPVPSAVSAGAMPAPAGRSLVAAIFPGQGSQYTDMFRGLATESGAGRDAIARLDVMARSAGHETLAEIAWRPDNGLGTRIWDTQWAMYLADLFAWEVLRGLGFAPDVVASHSFGEFPALAAAGAWSMMDGARATRARAAAVEAHGPRDGAMLSVIADKATVRAALEPFGERVWICAENAPDQFVIGGTARVVDAVEVLLESRRVRSKRLAVPSPFHTPLLAESAAHLATAVRSLPVVVPRLVSFSSTLAARVSTAEEVRESLIRQMTDTVRWIDVVRQMHAAGVRTFVEVGPSGVLTGLTRRILDGLEGVTFVQFDQRGRPADEQIARLRDQLGKAGAIRATAEASRSCDVSQSVTSGRRGTIVSFDATARRRERNRAGSAQRPLAVTASATTTGRAVTSRPAQAAVPAAASGESSERHANGNGTDVRQHGPSSRSAPRDEPKKPAERRPAILERVASAAAGDEIERFLVDFVVEQTGYPREIVELDADLEADLGIDSIRKAQLFGEIGQRYGLNPDDDVALDEFPTLRHLLAFMLPRVGGAGGTSLVAASVSRDRPAAPSSTATNPAPADVDSAAVLGGFHAMIVAGSDAGGPCGIVGCFGRHALPDVRRAVTAGIASTCVTAAATPGALAGWNDAGLIALAIPAGPDRRPMREVEAVVTTCRTIADARRLLTATTSAPVGIACLHVAGDGFRVTAGGVVEPLSDTTVACGARSPLERVALADGTITPPAALAALLDGRDSAARDALSTTCAWFACGIAAGAPVVVAGGPVAGPWLAADAEAISAAWSTAARCPAPSRSDQAADDADVTRRYGLALRALGPANRARSLAGERVLILASGGAADRLVEAVAAEGGVPVVGACGTPQEAMAAVDRAEQAGAVRHLLVAASGGHGDWAARRQAVIAAPFFACQRWIAVRSRAGDLDSSTLTAAVDLGGDFGLSGRIAAVEGGAICGLCKGIAREFPALHVRVVDAAGGTSAAGAQAVVAEMLSGVGPVEVGTAGGRRATVVAERRGPTPAKPLGSLARGSVWIVTGGARGVTAQCAREAGRRHGLVLALFGSTAPVAIDQAWLALDDAGLAELKGRVMREARDGRADPRSAWRAVEKSIEIARSLDRFSAAGVDARYFSCDLVDEAAVRAVVQRVACELGAIRGIIHGAGYESACRFERKTPEGLEATLAPKCIGLEHLLAAVDRDALEAVVGFGSTSGRLGGHGQTDYSLANEMLAKLLCDRTRGLRSTVFHWHAWDEVGMASRPESRFVLARLGLRFMPLAEGVRRFMDELEAGLPDAEVLVTEPAMCPGADETSAPVVRGQPIRGSLVARVEPREAATCVWFALDPTKDRFLLDHKQFGRPLLPAVMGAELLLQAVRAAGDDADEIRDFVVERPLGFAVDRPCEIRVDVAPAVAGRRDVRGWAEERVHLRGAVTIGPTEPITAVLDEPPFPHNPMVYRDDGPMWHGATFRTLSALWLDRNGGWGRLVAPDPDVVAAPRGAAGWTVPSALLDGCIVACAVYSYILCGQRVEVPVRFTRLRVAEQPRTGETCTVRLWFHAQTPWESVYDFVVFGADGRPLVALEGLHLSVLSPERSRPA